MQAVKNFIKTVLPRPAIQGLQSLRDNTLVLMQPRQQFNLAHLRPQSKLDLKAVLDPQANAAAWDEDNRAMNAAFGQPTIYAGANPGDRRFLHHLLLHVKPARVLETGTHVGASTASMALALKRNGTGHLTTVDIMDANAPDASWKKLNLPHSPAGILEQLGCRAQVTFVQQSSTEFMLKDNNLYDVIFLDGNHDGEFVYREVAAACKRLAPGGIMVLHDVFPGGKKLDDESDIIFGPDAALARIVRENPGLSRIGLTPLPWPAKGGGHTTSLTMLLRRA